MAFWNVAGLGNKDRNFWEALGQWDAIVLTETWVEENNWLRVKGRLPKGYSAICEEEGEKREGNRRDDNGN